MNQQYYLLASAIYRLSKGVLVGGGSSFSCIVKKCISFPFFYTEHTALCPHQEETKQKKNKTPQPSQPTKTTNPQSPSEVRI